MQTRLICRGQGTEREKTNKHKNLRAQARIKNSVLYIQETVDWNEAIKSHSRTLLAYTWHYSMHVFIAYIYLDMYLLRMCVRRERRRVIECISCGVDIAVKMYEIDIRIHMEYVWHGTLHFSLSFSLRFCLVSWFWLKQA